MTEQTVTLEPGESKTVSFTVKPSKAGLFQATVDGLTGTFEAKERWVTNAADISLGGRKMGTSAKYIWVQPRVINEGHDPGKFRVTCKFIRPDGAVIAPLWGQSPWTGGIEAGDGGPLRQNELREGPKFYCRPYVRSIGDMDGIWTAILNLTADGRRRTDEEIIEREIPPVYIPPEER